ncbi:MAG: Lactoylglutathione lyase and related lyases, partial [uncultured Sphingosinicella sp.]
VQPRHDRIQRHRALQALLRRGARHAGLQRGAIPQRLGERPHPPFLPPRRRHPRHFRANQRRAGMLGEWRHDRLQVR